MERTPQIQGEKHDQLLRQNPCSLFDIWRPYDTVKKLLIDPNYFWYLAGMLLIGEFTLNTLIVQKVAYTEIDWVAYMQEVEGFLSGERDYKQLRGDTGPLVYPAGFVYIYSALYYLTDRGTNIRLAQYIFEGLYLVTQWAVFYIYSMSKKVPPYSIVLLCLSKRLHSIYVLRCFNDPVAMFFLYTSILCMLKKRWTASSMLYSFGLSIKMNVLLFFPAFGILLWQSVGAWATMVHLVLMIGIQAGLGYPFLTTYPTSYLSRAFEFSRVFDYRWTVNWRMVDEKTFVSAPFANALLTGHVLTLILFLTMVWCKKQGGIWRIFWGGFTGVRRSIPADEIITTLFVSNLIGITFARSLHYQFYSWYFHTLSYLLWHAFPTSSRRPGVLKDVTILLFRTLILLRIELCWLTFPSTPSSSWALLVCHIMILAGLYKFC